MCVCVCVLGVPPAEFVDSGVVLDPKTVNLLEELRALGIESDIAKCNSTCNNGVSAAFDALGGGGGSSR